MVPFSELWVAKRAAEIMERPMAEHTPGPWTLRTAETYTVRAPDEGAVCQAKWLRGRHGLGGRRTDEEVMANARLIAAAPDLLAAIIQSDDAHWTPAMRAAIAKATGAS